MAGTICAQSIETRTALSGLHPRRGANATASIVSDCRLGSARSILEEPAAKQTFRQPSRQIRLAVVLDQERAAAEIDTAAGLGGKPGGQDRAKMRPADFR